MRVAVPLSEDGIVARVFDTATRMLIVDLYHGNRYERAEIPTFVRPPRDRAMELVSFGVDVLLCEGISEVLAARIREQGICIGLPISANPDDVIADILRNPQTYWSRPANAA